MRYIYALKDPRNNKVMYVGQSKHPKERLRQHINQYKIKNIDLFNWIKELVNDSYLPILEILEPCENELSNEREVFWITKFGIENLLNSVVNGKYSKVSCDRISQSNKGKQVNLGKHFSEVHKDNLSKAQPHQRSILQFDLQNNFIKEWANPCQVQRELKIFATLIRKCCKGERNHTGGFIWKYKHEKK